MKVRKHIYIEEDLLELIEDSDKENLSIYISKLITNDIANKEKEKKELDQKEKNIKYLLNHLNTQNQIILNLLTNFMSDNVNQDMISYHSSTIYQHAKSLVDDDKRKKKDKMRGK